MSARRRTTEAPIATHKHGDLVPTTRVVTCPQCGGDSVYAPSNPYRPFCSRRCKEIDFGAWADEAFRVAENQDAESPSHGDDSRLQ